jgi:hypothetical protein
VKQPIFKTGLISRAGRADRTGRTEFHDRVVYEEGDAWGRQVGSFWVIPMGRPLKSLSLNIRWIVFLAAAIWLVSVVCMWIVGGRKGREGLA